MVQWTDVDLTIKIKDADLTEARNVHVTLAQNGKDVLDTADVTVLSADTVGCHLTPPQTGALLCSVPARMYVNWEGPNGRCRAKVGQNIVVEENYPRRPL